jgi:hypothetical protein
MKTLELNQMEKIEGGGFWKALQCATAIAGTAIFIGGIFATTGPLGLYVANAVLGPTIAGVAIAGCVAN